MLSLLLSLGKSVFPLLAFSPFRDFTSASLGVDSLADSKGTKASKKQRPIRDTRVAPFDETNFDWPRIDGLFPRVNNPNGDWLELAFDRFF